MSGPAARNVASEPHSSILADVEELARLFRALGHSTRLCIVELLLDAGELDQVEIMRRLGADHPLVPEQLRHLVGSGFIKSRVQGRRTLYRILEQDVRWLLAQARRWLS